MRRSLGDHGLEVLYVSKGLYGLSFLGTSPTDTVTSSRRRDP